MRRPALLKDQWSAASPFRFQSVAFLLVTLIVRFFYVWSTRNSLNFLAQYDNLLGFRDLPLLWPVKWASFTGLQKALDIVIVWSFVFNLLAISFPGRQVFRICVAIGFLMQLSFEYSYGDVGHASHMTMWTLFAIALLPSWGSKSPRVARQRVINYFFFAQIQIAVFYGAAGLWKLCYAVYQLLAGQPNAFQIDGFSRVLALRLLNGNTDTMLGDFLVRHTFFGFLGFWVAILGEISALYFVFFPRYHRPLGVALIIFHLFAAISLSPIFALNVVLVGLFFVCSPFPLARQLGENK